MGLAETLKLTLWDDVPTQIVYTPPPPHTLIALSHQPGAFSWEGKGVGVMMSCPPF
jgi:hypothetical protein